MMQAILNAGYGYEFVGLIFFMFYLTMTRGKNAGRYSLRSRMLVIVAAFALVGCVLFRYATTNAGVTAMVVLSVVALGSVFMDARRGPAP
jgi:formate-dependent nitrite reductase membrane component NrfD